MNKRFWMIPTLLIFTIWLAGCGLVGFEEEKERPKRLDVSAWPTAVPATPPPIPTPFPKTTVHLDPTPEPVAAAAVAGSTTAEIQTSLDFSGSLTELAEQVRILTGGLTPVGAAFVTVEGSTVRQGPGESFDALDTLGQGDITALLGLNADNDWLYVVTQSLVQGWLPVEAVRVTGGLAAAPVLSPEQLATTASQTDISALANTANGDLPSSPTTSVFAKLNPVAAAFLTVDSSPLYNRPSASSTSVASLEQGEVAGVLGKDASGEWLFVVTVDLEFGWLPADRLRTVGALEEARVLPPDPIAAFAPPPSTAPAAPAAVSGGVSAGQTIEIDSLAPVGTARVRTAALNLRQRPGAEFKLLDTLAQADEVSILALNRDQQWALVKTAGDQLGWGSVAFLEVDGSLAGAPQVKTLTPDETYPADQAAPIVALSAASGTATATSSVGNTGPAASGVSPTSSAGSSPSAPSGTLAPIASATVAEKTDMRRGPAQEFGPVATVTVDEPVSIHGTNAQRDWVVVTATNGRAGWVPLASLSVAGSIPEVPPISTAWVDSNDIEVRTGPGIFFDSAGKLAINNLVSVIGLNDGRNWALVETLPGGLGWIPLRFLTISGSLANIGQVDSAVLAGAGNVAAEPDLPVPSGPPTGKLALQTSSGGDIMLINADGTGLRRLTSGIDPALSPDGQKVAFTRWEGATGTLWEINVDGTGERPILGETRKAKGPDWSPDGSQIVLNFQHGGRLEEKVTCLALKGGRPNIPRNATDVRIGIDRGSGSPELCYDLPPDPEWGLRVVDVAGGSFEDLFGGFYAFRPAWDPNQPWRVVSDSGSGLLAVDVNRAEFRQPLTDKVEDGAPAFSPDGRFIAFVTDVQGGHDIFRMNGDGSGRIRLTQTPLWVPVQPDSDGKQWNNVSPTWSPDGSQIAFLTDRTGRWEIWIMNADGANQRPMFPADITNQLEIAYDFVDERALSWR